MVLTCRDVVQVVWYYNEKKNKEQEQVCYVNRNQFEMVMIGKYAECVSFFAGGPYMLLCADICSLVNLQRQAKPFYKSNLVIVSRLLQQQTI